MEKDKRDELDRSKYPPFVAIDNYAVLSTGEYARWTIWTCECGTTNGDTSRCKRCRRIFNLKEIRRDLMCPPQGGRR